VLPALVVECGALEALPNPNPLPCDAVAENCGAGCNWTEPVFATWLFRWLRLPKDPRAIPNPAEPLFSVM